MWLPPLLGRAEFNLGDFSGDMPYPSIGQALLNQCRFRTRLQVGTGVGPPSNNVVDFNMTGGSVGQCILNLDAALDTTTQHSYVCIFSGVSFFPFNTSISDVLLVNGSATFHGCTFGVSRNANSVNLSLVKMGLSAKKGSILQVKNCSFSIYGQSVVCKCIDNPNSFGARVFHGGNVAQNISDFYGNNTISTTSGTGVFIDEPVF